MQNLLHAEQYLESLEDGEFKKEYHDLVAAYKRLLKVIKISDSVEEQMYREKKLSDANAEKHKIESEAAAIANQMKSDFLAHMSHEIRTPLNGIIGFISILKHQEIAPEKLKYLDIIDHSSHTLLSIINDILDFSKIETGKMGLDEHDFNAHQEFKSVGELFGANAEAKGIKLHCLMDPSVPEFLHGDSTKIKQVIGNLVSNAIKFTPKGGDVFLSLSYDASKKHFIASVKDSGIGIPKEKQESIFEAYSQADTNTQRHFGGTGLGLAICYRLIELMNGKLQLESQENKGSTFSFWVPVSETQTIHHSSKNEKLSFNGQHILIADDSTTNQLLFTLLLEDMNLKCTTVSDGSEVFELYEKEHFDLILMDQNMPRQSGTETAKRIRDLELQNAKTRIPIIAVTADVMNDTAEKMLSSGMDAYLTKPIEAQELKKVLNTFLT